MAPETVVKACFRFQSMHSATGNNKVKHIVHDVRMRNYLLQCDRLLFLNLRVLHFAEDSIQNQEKFENIHLDGQYDTVFWAS